MLRASPQLNRSLFAVLMCAVAWLYFARLGTAVPYLSIEEVAVAQQGITVARTGRDDSGRTLPLYITERSLDQGGGPHDPVWVYADAILLKLAPFSEGLMRVPSATAGVISVWLMFLVARRIFRSDWLGLTAAAVLAATPGQFLQSRIGSQQSGPVPFFLLWLLLVVRYLDTGRRRELLCAGLVLGLGTYSYIAAAVFLPCCFIAMVTALCPLGHAGEATRKRSCRDLGVAALGFGVALLPMVLWHLAHPERLRQLADYYTHHGYNEDVTRHGLLSAEWVTTRLDLWWNTLNPERLLFSGDSDYRYSTRQVGYLLVPTGALAVLGLVRLRQVMSTELVRLIIIVLVLAPLPVVVAGDDAIKRWLPLLSLFALLTTAGVRVISEHRSLAWRVLGGLLAIGAVVQFAAFLRYYHRDYAGAANFFYGGNIRGAVREVLAATDDPACVLIDQRIDQSVAWRLYARVEGRDEFEAPYEPVDLKQPSVIPSASCRRSSLVVREEELLHDPDTARRLSDAGWRETRIPEVNGKPGWAVYRLTVR